MHRLETLSTHVGTDLHLRGNDRIRQLIAHLKKIVTAPQSFSNEFFKTLFDKLYTTTN